MARIVVVGAGVGGLATAARLAATGHQVTVFERADTVGGKLGRYAHDTPAGSFHFDTGPSLLTLPAGLRRPVRGDRGEARRIPGPGPAGPDRPARLSADGGPTLDSCADPAEFAARIGAAFGDRAAADWQRLWRRAERVWEASWRDILRRTVDSPRDLASLAWRRRRPGRHRPGPHACAAWAAGTCPTRGCGCCWTGTPPTPAPTRAGRRPRWSRSRTPSWPSAAGTCAAGWARSPTRCCTRCLDLGVVVQTDATVTRIDAAGGRVHGVRLAGGTAPVPADVVVANADALTVYRDLLPHAASAGRADRPQPRRLRAAARRLAAAPGWPTTTSSSRPTTTPSSTRSSATPGGAYGPGRRPTRRCSSPWPTTRLVRPAGHEAWFVLVNAPRQGSAAGRGRLATPGAGRRVRRPDPGRAGRGAAWTCATGCCSARSAPRPTWTRRPARRAARSTAPPAGCSARANRGPAHGLFLVGGSTHPGGGLPMVTLSAQIVADEIGPAW